MSEVKTKTVAVAQTVKPIGFDSLDATEFAPPVIKLWAKMTQAKVEGGELGQFYDVSRSKAIGTSFKMNLLAIKNSQYTKTDPKTNLEKITYTKSLLVYTGGSIPKILQLSVTSFGNVKKVLTAAYEASIEAGGLPLYAFNITTTCEVTSNPNGSFAVANFTLGDKVSAEELQKLNGMYEQFGKTFSGEKEVAVEDVFA